MQQVPRGAHRTLAAEGSKSRKKTNSDLPKRKQHHWRDNSCGKLPTLTIFSGAERLGAVLRSAKSAAFTAGCAHALDNLKSPFKG